jgi:hypothetical protein
MIVTLENVDGFSVSFGLRQEQLSVFALPESRVGGQGSCSRPYCPRRADGGELGQRKEHDLGIVASLVGPSSPRYWQKPSIPCNTPPWIVPAKSMIEARSEPEQ